MMKLRFISILLIAALGAYILAATLAPLGMSDGGGF